MKNLFKKAVSLTIALGTVAALSAPAFAEVIGTYYPDKTTVGETTYAADTVTVPSYTEVTGATQYAVAVVPANFSGKDTDIYYVNQYDASTISSIIDGMLVKGDLPDGQYEVRIGNNAPGTTKYEAIPFTVSSQKVDYFTATTADKVTVTSKNIRTANMAKWWTSEADTEEAKVFAATSHKVKIVLDETAYPTADGSTYNITVVDNSENPQPVANAEVYYSTELGFYVALVPKAAVDAGYKFAVEKAANTATVLGAFGEMNGRTPINLVDANRIAAVYNNGNTGNTALTTNAQVMVADVTNDGQVNLLDANQVASKYNKALDAYTIEK